MEQKGGGEGRERIESLQQKLEEFGRGLEPDEQKLYQRLVNTDLLHAALAGRLDIQRMREDDGFWAQWAQRQY
jgi:hypothetical protein